MSYRDKRRLEKIIQESLDKTKKEKERKHNTKKSATNLVEYFSYSVRTKLEKIPVLTTHKDTKLLKLLIKYYGYELCKEVIDRVIDEWERMKQSQRIPTISLLFREREEYFQKKNCQKIILGEF